MRAILPVLLIPFLAVLASCNSTGQITAANGRSAYETTCGGLFGSQIDCNLKASQLCPSGFDPIESSPGRLVFTCSRRPVPPTAPI